MFNTKQSWLCHQNGTDSHQDIVDQLKYFHLVLHDVIIVTRKHAIIVWNFKKNQSQILMHFLLFRNWKERKCGILTFRKNNRKSRMLSLKDIMVSCLGFCTPLLQYNLNIGITVTSTIELTNTAELRP